VATGWWVVGVATGAAVVVVMVVVDTGYLLVVGTGYLKEGG
jgi:hypothetical protein